MDATPAVPTHLLIATSRSSSVTSIGSLRDLTKTEPSDRTDSGVSGLLLRAEEQQKQQRL
jgi:hypothetical protein